MPAFSWFSRLPAPSLALQRAFAVAAVITQAGIAVTGSVVRVTGSGLGCPTWPECFPGSLTPVAHPEFHAFNQWVEFSNRLLTGVVGFVGAACLIAALLVRPRRRRLVWLAASMPAGVAAQAVIGGFTVLTGLVWWSVAVHFLVSMVLVWLAVLLLRAVGEGEGPVRRLVPRPLRALQVANAGVLAALLVAGTLVTSAGPHSGDSKTPRLDLPIATLAQVHADLLFLYLGVLVGLGFGLRASGVDRRIWSRYWWLIGVVLAQGCLGMVQYWTGVPEVLAAIHVLGAGVVVVATAALWTATRDYGPIPAPPTPASGRTADAPATTAA
ncbi:COX15/CtaA family protein [Streptoalloteichus hindustanus]|uniref:Cytochrome c oxidase assembly protein subunit 15 n=1 Tax=Streptoalloteichus hindustanus TaxID=2017 RepID=A0A1M4Y2M7_STRHI|nr:COX15/CtaA family protein [Streptoalloteichus hindustanus]SHF00084.1 cytochrome c oxidase assembly protein subunit 15 [Streptoalloteichus hindustanus]